jgi:hypothetical protein
MVKRRYEILLPAEFNDGPQLEIYVTSRPIEVL